MGDVHEHGSSGDVEKSRSIAMKLANGNVEQANALLREAEATARGIVQKYQSAILKLAFRLQVKKELILDIAESEIRTCISAFEKKPVFDAECQAKINKSRARSLVREHMRQEATKALPTKALVTRTWDFSNPKDAADWCARNGLKPGSEIKGNTDGYISRDKR
jgi:hypothetical protein